MRTDPSQYIPTSADPSEIWIEWHKSLRKWFSRNEANSHFLRFWQQRAGAGTTADTHSLRSYMQKQGVNLSTTTAGELTDMSVGVFNWFKNSATTARTLVIIGILAAMGLVIFYVVHSIRKGNSLTAAVPQLRGLKALQQIR